MIPLTERLVAEETHLLTMADTVATLREQIHVPCSPGYRPLCRQRAGCRAMPAAHWYARNVLVAPPVSHVLVKSQRPALGPQLASRSAKWARA